MLSLLVFICYWLLVLVLTALLIAFSIHFLVNLIDLENDYLNPIDMCRVVNKYVYQEYMIQALLASCLLVGNYWMEFLLLLPILLMNLWNYLHNKHLLDPTRIYDDLEKKRNIICCIVIVEVFFFFWFLYRFISGLIFMI